MTTSRILSGMPCCLTQSTCKSVSRRSSDCRPSGQANDNRARREILHDEDASTPRNGIFWIHGVGVERLTAAADRHLHLPQPARSDGCRYETHSANDLLVTHGCTLIIPRFRCA